MTEDGAFPGLLHRRREAVGGKIGTEQDRRQALSKGRPGVPRQPERLGRKGHKTVRPQPGNGVEGVLRIGAGAQHSLHVRCQPPDEKIPHASRTLSGKKDEHPAPPGHQGRHAFREDAPGFGKVPFREEHPLRRSRGAGAPGRHYAGDLVLGYRQEGMGIRGQVIRDREGQCAIFAKRPGKSFREGGETAPVEGAVPTGTGHSRPDRGEAVFVQASGVGSSARFSGGADIERKGRGHGRFPPGDTPPGFIRAGASLREYRSRFLQGSPGPSPRPTGRAGGTGSFRRLPGCPRTGSFLREGPPPPGTTPPDP